MADKKDDIVLSIRDMSKSFGRNRVLDHINLDVKRGTVMGLMGENGAGKSTMMKCLFGTYQKDDGKIFLDGKEVSFSGPKDALENGYSPTSQQEEQPSLHFTNSHCSSKYLSNFGSKTSFKNFSYLCNISEP